MKVGQVDKFVSSMAEKMKKIGMETEVDDKEVNGKEVNEVNDNATDLVAMPKMDILRTD